MRRVTKKFLIFLSGIVFTYFYCEYLIYYVVILQCTWPSVKADENILKSLIIADTHLLTEKNHWFDKLRREWQMRQAFKAIINIHRPDVVFVLGDLFDQGEWSFDHEFKNYVQRFNTLFPVPEGTAIHVVAGNHDVGFHNSMSQRAVKRFDQLLKSPMVQLLPLKNNYFVLVNSMAMQGDMCKLCQEARAKITNISEILKQLNENNEPKYRSQPILMQHFPLYRLSDAECTETDTPLPERNRPFVKHDALSRESTEYLVFNIRPRAVFGGHTHHGCVRHHVNENPKAEFYEYSVASFSWRNRFNPKYMLVSITPDEYAVSNCGLPQELTIVCTAIILIFISLLLSFEIKKIGK